MSDPAPPVAATLRDKSVEDLKEEIEERAKKTSAHGAIFGIEKVYRVAVTGPSPTQKGQARVLYAVGEVDLKYPEEEEVDDNGFVVEYSPLGTFSSFKGTTLTLSDLPETQIYCNRNTSGPLGLLTNPICVYYDINNPQAPVDSFWDADPPGTKDLYDNKLALAYINEENRFPVSVWFGLEGVPPEKYFEFIFANHDYYELPEGGMKEYIGLLGKASDYVGQFSVQDLIDFFGGSTVVTFTELF